MEKLIEELEESLKSYSIDIHYWEPYCGDTHILLGNRAFLQKHLDRLSADQRKQLSETDNKVLGLASIQNDVEDDDDVRILQLCVDVINGIEI